MNCTDFKSAIDSAIENREALRTEFAAHLLDCSDETCRRAWEDAVLLDRAIAHWRATRPAVDVVDAVLSGCRTADQATVRPARVPPCVAGSAGARVATAVAAAALLALALLSSESEHPDTGPPLLASNAGDSAGNAGLAYVTYAQNAAHIVTDAVVLSLGGSEQMEDATVTAPGIGWNADWPPLGEVHAALDDLLESLPAEPPQS